MKPTTYLAIGLASGIMIGQHMPSLGTYIDQFIEYNSFENRVKRHNNYYPQKDTKNTIKQITKVPEPNKSQNEITLPGMQLKSPPYMNSKLHLDTDKHARSVMTFYDDCPKDILEGNSQGPRCTYEYFASWTNINNKRQYHNIITTSPLLKNITQQTYIYDFGNDRTIDLTDSEDYTQEEGQIIGNKLRPTIEKILREHSF